jgi:hypothetical protein
MPQGQLGVEVVPERIANAQTLGDFKDGGTEGPWRRGLLSRKPRASVNPIRIVLDLREAK